jgi:hypothetical protein
MIQEFCSPNWRFGRKFQSAPGGTAAAWMAESPHVLLVGRSPKVPVAGRANGRSPAVSGRFRDISGDIGIFGPFRPSCRLLHS